MSNQEIKSIWAQKISECDDCRDLVKVLNQAEKETGCAAEVIDVTNLPTFGGEEPDDTTGVYSWDEDDLLIPDCAGRAWGVIPRG